MGAGGSENVTCTHTCPLQAPDGTVLCTCGKKKIQWWELWSVCVCVCVRVCVCSLLRSFVQAVTLHCLPQVQLHRRSPAHLVDPEPLSARLRFEPRGRGNVDDKYYLSDKRNRVSRGRVGPGRAVHSTPLTLLAPPPRPFAVSLLLPGSHCPLSYEL